MSRTVKILWVIAFAAAIVSFFSFNLPLRSFEHLVANNSLTSAIVFIALMFTATVVAPIAAMPLVPIAAPILGPFATAVYSVIGWWLGAMAAFFIARLGGKPLLMKFISLDKLSRFESQVPEKMTFWWLVLLRIIIPVDVLSYAVGLISTISFTLYATATFIGIIPFAFLFSYGGNAFAGMNYVEFAVISIAALLLFLSVLYSFFQYNGYHNHIRGGGSADEKE